ncbi:MAG: GTPase [Eubacteriales bacterium]|nr:GTPase [Eubacteriales bacterium]
MEIPVYLFTGFLEGGKTKFIQETFEDPRFNSGERTLLVVCEEGVEEYDKSRFCCDIGVEYIDDIEQINSTYLTSLQKKYKAQRVIIEYNGMWSINTLIENMPKNWLLYQEMMFTDATKFVNYNNNMRQLMVDKLQGSELIVLNRANDNLDKMEIHKIIRGISRRCDIAYEYADGHTEYDEIEDPLPFDIEADVIEIKDKDYAIWYRDLGEELDKYEGKVVKFKGLVAKDKSFDNKMFLIGRQVMTCCIEDVTFKPMICDCDNASQINSKGWYVITARINIKKHKLYKARGPVLTLMDYAISSAPDQEIATFY